MTSDIPAFDPPSFEDRKFQQETADKKRELDLREREIVANEKELLQSRWSSPLVIGLCAAAIGLGGNIWVEHANNKWTNSMERNRAQSTLILEAIKTGSSDKACQNLIFFVNLRLIDDARSIRDQCASAPQGPPSLPVNLSSSRASVPSLIGSVIDGRTKLGIHFAEIVTAGGRANTADDGQFILVLPSSYAPGDSIAIVVTKSGYETLKKQVIVGVPLELILNKTH